MTLFKKGIGNIVVVVLLVTVGIIGIVLIWGIIGPLLNEGGFSDAGKDIADFSPDDINGECKALVYNGDGKVDVVFFSGRDLAKEYVDFFNEVEPFSDNQERFNFFYVPNYDVNCETYLGVALLCYSKALVKKAAVCPNDYIVVLEDSGNLRSSAYLNVMSLNSNHPKTVFIHEFGHAFANLAEEYVDENAKIPRGSKNCVQEESGFIGPSDGSYEGCTKGDYWRSIANGVMRTLSTGRYGIFNENLIRAEIGVPSVEQFGSGDASVTGSAISLGYDCSDEVYRLVEANFVSENEIRMVGSSVQQGCVGENGNGDFSFTLTSEGGELVSEGNFNPQFIFSDAPGTGAKDLIDGEVFEYSGNFVLKMPVLKEGALLELEDADGNNPVPPGGGGGGAGSFLPGTQIIMADKSTKSIEEIIVGDSVWSYDIESKKYTEEKVIGTFNHTMPGYYSIDNKLYVTAINPILVNGEWKLASEVVLGDELLTYDGGKEIVESKEYVEGEVVVYNLAISGTKIYFAGGWGVHNQNLPEPNENLPVPNEPAFAVMEKDRAFYLEAYFPQSDGQVPQSG